MGTLVGDGNTALEVCQSPHATYQSIKWLRLLRQSRKIHINRSTSGAAKGKNMSFILPENWTVKRLQGTEKARLHYICVTVPDATTGTRDIIQPAGSTANPSQFVKVLKDHGAILPPSAKAVEVVQAIEMATSESVDGVFARTTGWHAATGGLVYVFPSLHTHDSDAKIYSDPALVQDSLCVGTEGTLESWKEQVASLAEASVYASFAIMVALAGCLAKFSGLPELFVINLFGKSSTGKTTSINAAASVWGPSSSISRWLSSPTGLLHAAAANSDSAFILDDVEKSDFDPKRRPEFVREMIHPLTGGQTRRVARGHREALPDLEFRVIPLSTSPASIRSEVATRGAVPLTFGDGVRLLELAVPDGEQGGIWASNSAVLGQTPADLSKALSLAAKGHYGTAGPALVKFVLENQAHIVAMLSRYGNQFSVPITGDHEDMKGRILDKMRLVYASARIARKAGILPWSKAKVFSVVASAYHLAIETSFAEVGRQHRLITLLHQVLNDKRKFIRFGGRTSDFTFPEGYVGAFSRDAGRFYAQLGPIFRQLGECSGEAVKGSEQNGLISLLLASGSLLPGQGESPTRTIQFANSKQRMLEFDVAGLKKVFDDFGVLGRDRNEPR